MPKKQVQMGVSSPYTHTFPAIRGIQSGREYYVTMVPMRLLAELFIFNNEGLPPEFRAQRILNKARVPEITRYIKNNPKDYVLSALTASIDRRVRFEPLQDYDTESRLGMLVVPMDAKFLINDGQHRRAAIVEALKDNFELGREGIAIVLFVDAGLRRSQQMFTDLNKYAIRPTKSLGVLYDHKDPMADLVRELIIKIPLFKDRIEKEKTTISNRSKSLFTLSAVYQSTRALLGKKKKFEEVSQKEIEIAYEFWNELPNHIPEWKDLLENRVSSAELRRTYVHAHGVVIHALGLACNALISTYPEQWITRLKKLEEVDWRRENPIWEGRALSGGR
ncbi:MAG: DNA sulfur modification protein DndB, partial [Nitrososphaerales archaeon]